MNARWISPAGVETVNSADLPALLQREGGFVWLDISRCDEQAARILTDVFHLNAHAVQDCQTSSPVPKVHTHSNHVFVVLHGVELTGEGRGQLLQLGHFIGSRFLVTVHGPVDGNVPFEAAVRETEWVLRRIESGRLRPENPPQLAHAIISALTVRLESLVAGIASRVLELERSVLKGERADPEKLLERMFRLRHELLTIRTTASHSQVVFARRSTLARDAPPERLWLIHDVTDQYERLKNLCDGEKDFLDEVVDFYQSRTVTKMNIAVERLTLLAGILLPITAISSIYGMNVIVNDQTNFVHLAVVLFLMVSVAGAMLLWAKRQGWW